MVQTGDDLSFALQPLAKVRVGMTAQGEMTEITTWEALPAQLLFSVRLHIHGTGFPAIDRALGIRCNAFRPDGRGIGV